MATFTASDTFSSVYVLKPTDPVVGGTFIGSVTSPNAAHSNAQGQSLANRTLFLYNRLVPIGSIHMWASSVIPDGYLLCDGSQQSSTGALAELFSVIGYQFGQPVATLDFNLPDMRGQFPRGYSGSSTLDPDKATRGVMAAGGASGNNIGSVQGDSMEAHDHGGGSHTHNVIALAQDDAGGGTSGSGALVGGIDDSIHDGQATTGSPDSTVIASEGGNENRPTNVYLNFIIKSSI